MSLTLFDDQKQWIDDIRASFGRGNRRIVGVAPTGFGKTVCYSYIASGIAAKKKRVVILEHRDFLIDQTSDTLREFRVPHSLLLGGQIGIPRSNVTIASVFTLAKRLRHFPPPDLIVCDEGHHCIPDSTFAKCVEAFPEARVLAVTATPCRLDGRGLGEMFQDMILGPTTAELIAMGRLVPFEVYASPTPVDVSGLKRRAGDYAVGELEAAMDKPTLVGSAVSHYKRLADGKLAVDFCVSIKHAEDEAEGFRNAGISAKAIHGKMDRAMLKQYMDAFRKREIRVLTACDLIGEGYDCPAIEVAILRRPTQSLSLYLQQVGRGLRTATGKDRLLILDHAGNTAKHGLPDEDRAWSLAGAEKRERGETAAPVRTCPACFAMHRPSPICPRCGHVYVVAGRVIEQVEGDLVRVVGGEQVSPEDAELKERQRQYGILVNIGRRRGYENPEGWAMHVVSAKYAKKLAGEREPDGPTVNGLTEAERARVIRAMSKEGVVV